MAANVAAIETHELAKNYGEVWGVIDLDLRVEAGEIFGFLGPNGAGKTTTIRLLMDQIRPTRGRATIFGKDCQADTVEIKSMVGYLPGELALWNNLTGRQTLTYLGNLRGGVDPAVINEMAERLQLDLNRKFREYSRGNKVKVGIVQALMHRPRLLVLDEPTAGLDPLNQLEFFRMIAEARDAGATVFLSSHILSEVERSCDRVGIIREGRIVRTGSVREVVAEKLYHMTLTLSVPAGEDVRRAFEVLPNVSQVEGSDHTLEFVVQGDVGNVLKEATNFPVLTMTSHEPTLEEAFLSYYQASGDGSKPAQAGSIEHEAAKAQRTE